MPGDSAHLGPPAGGDKGTTSSFSTPWSITSEIRHGGKGDRHPVSPTPYAPHLGSRGLPGPCPPPPSSLGTSRLGTILGSLSGRLSSDPKWQFVSK